MKIEEEEEDKTSSNKRSMNLGWGCIWGIMEGIAGGNENIES